MKNRAIKHPFISSVIIIFSFFVVMLLASFGIGSFGPGFLVNNGDYVFQTACECFVALLAIIYSFLFGQSDIWNESGKGFKNGIGTGGYFIFVAITAAVAMVAQMITDLARGMTYDFVPVWKMIIYVLCMFLVGLAEETLFRGVVANLFFKKYAHDPAGVWTATLWSGFIFGSMHMMNILSSDPVGVIVQVISATAMGMALTAVYYRSRNIWALIFIHAFNNICAGLIGGITEGGSISADIGSYTPFNALSGGIFVIVTLILLRPLKLREIVLEEKNFATPEEAIESYNKSKKKRSVAVAVVSVTCAVLFAISCVLYFFDLGGFSVYSAESWNGEDYFTEEYAFTADESGAYQLTVQSLPSNSSAFMTLKIVDTNGQTVYNASFKGRYSSTEPIILAQGDYLVICEYNYVDVQDGSDAEYITAIEIK